MNPDSPNFKSEMTVDTESGTKVVFRLFVRSSIVSTKEVKRQKSILTKLEQLQEQKVFDEFSVRVWGNPVGLNTVLTNNSDQSSLQQLHDFKVWARDAGVSLEPFFQWHLTESSSIDSIALVRLPVLSLTEYEGGSIRSVVPHTDMGIAQTVEDRLTSLE